ncbi:hypothetical protein JCM10296v2_002025 [Rhodotorula toruloides]
MAQREADAEAGLIGPGEFDLEILEDARASTVWTNRLIDAGVNHVFLGGPTQFRRGLRRYKGGTVYQDKLRHYALASAGEDVILFFSRHFDHPADPDGAIRGHLRGHHRSTVFSAASNVAVLNRSAFTVLQEKEE